MSSASYQPRQFIPPSVGDLPEQFTPMIERLVGLRERWAEATQQVNAARQALLAAPGQYRDAVTQAAAAGRDVAKVVDPREAAVKASELAELAEAGLHNEVVGAWQELWNAVANDHDTVMAHAEKPCEELTQRVLDLQAQVQQAKADLGVALGVRRWVASRTTPCDWQWARQHAARPQPLADADTTTLSKVRREEAKAADQARREQEARAAHDAIAAERQRALDESDAKRRDRPRTVKTGPIPSVLRF